MSRNTEIKLNITLDDNHLAEHITWDAPDGGISNRQASAFFISLWDKTEGNTMRVELWEKDLMVDEMKHFIHQSMLSLSEVYQKATGDEQLSNDIRQFCMYFAEKSGIVNPS